MKIFASKIDAFMLLHQNFFTTFTKLKYTCFHSSIILNQDTCSIFLFIGKHAVNEGQYK